MAMDVVVLVSWLDACRKLQIPLCCARFIPEVPSRLTHTNIPFLIPSINTILRAMFTEALRLY